MSPAATLLVASLAAALVTMAVSLNVTSARPEPTSSGGGNASEGAQDRPPDYYSAYEYPDVPLNDTVAGPVEPGVIPDPCLQQDESEEPPVELPDDSLADTDLHDHDLIDSVVYIYFGGKPRERRGAGRQVVVAAAALALVAQLLTLAAALRRLKASPRDAAAAILLNTELSLVAGGLAMLLGVQATRDHQWCQGFALLLHYLNLVTCCWLLTISVHNLQRLQSETPPSGCLLHISCALSWVLPALVVLGCFLEDPRSYETRHYCFMSVERGMLVSYMVPVSSLIVANTVLTVCSLRLVSRDEMLKPQEFEDETRFALRFSAALLPLYAVGWFLVVVALENPDTLVLSLLYGTVANFINWFMLGCSSKILPPSVCPGGDGLVLLEDSAAKALRAGADCQPLLDRDITSLVWGPPPQSPTPSLGLGLSHLPLGGEVLELRLDAISTISS